jgi:hypothetical protein
MCHDQIMDTLALNISNHLYVVIGRHAATERLLDLAARLALRGPLVLLDCGNRANPYPLVKELRRLTRDPLRALGNIQSARAFTCYQVVALLEQALDKGPAGQPMLIFDLLSTFYDENVTLAECRRLLEGCLERIAAASCFAPVVVSARREMSKLPERAVLLERICQAASRAGGEIWEEELPVPPGSGQMNLFDAEVDIDLTHPGPPSPEDGRERSFSGEGGGSRPF